MPASQNWLRRDPIRTRPSLGTIESEAALPMEKAEERGQPSSGLAVLAEAQAKVSKLALIPIRSAEEKAFFDKTSIGRHENAQMPWKQRKWIAF